MSILALHGARVSIRHSDTEHRATGWAATARRTVTRWIARSRQRRALREIAESNDFHLLKDIGIEHAREWAVSHRQRRSLGAANADRCIGPRDQERAREAASADNTRGA